MRGQISFFLMMSEYPLRKISQFRFLKSEGVFLYVISKFDNIKSKAFLVLNSFLMSMDFFALHWQNGARLLIYTDIFSDEGS